MTEETHEDKDEQAVVYELGYHLVPSLGEDDLALRVTELQKAVTAQGGSVISEGQPQTCELSYTMRKLRGGVWDRYDSSFFGWVRFEAQPSTMATIKEALDTDEYLVRYLIIKLDPIALTPEPVREQKPQSTEVEVEPKELVKKQDDEDKGEVSDEELEKQIEQLIQ